MIATAIIVIPVTIAFVRAEANDRKRHPPYDYEKEKQKAIDAARQRYDERLAAPTDSNSEIMPTHIPGMKVTGGDEDAFDYCIDHVEYDGYTFSVQYLIRASKKNCQALKSP